MSSSKGITSMAKVNKTQFSEKELAAVGMYGGYDVRWLSREPEHPDFHLVAEFKEKYPEYAKGLK